VGGDALRLGR